MQRPITCWTACVFCRRNTVVPKLSKTSLFDNSWRKDVNKTFVSQTSATFCSGHPWPSPMSASKTSGRPRMKAHSKMVNSCVPAWWFKLCPRKLGNLAQLPRCRIHATPSSHGVRNGRQSSYIISTLSTEEKIWPSFHNIPGLLFLAGKRQVLLRPFPFALCPRPCLWDSWFLAIRTEVPTTIFKSILAPAILHQPRY